MSSAFGPAQSPLTGTTPIAHIEGGGVVVDHYETQLAIRRWLHTRAWMRSAEWKREYSCLPGERSRVDRDLSRAAEGMTFAAEVLMKEAEAFIRFAKTGRGEDELTRLDMVVQRLGLYVDRAIGPDPILEHVVKVRFETHCYFRKNQPLWPRLRSTLNRLTRDGYLPAASLEAAEKAGDDDARLIAYVRELSGHEVRAGAGFDTETDIAAKWLIRHLLTLKRNRRPEPSAAPTASQPGPAPKLDEWHDQLMVSCIDIVRKYPSVPRKAFEKRLTRWRMKNDGDWRETANPRRSESRYAYRWGAIRSIVEGMLKPSLERPSTK